MEQLKACGFQTAGSYSWTITELKFARITIIAARLLKWEQGEKEKKSVLSFDAYDFLYIKSVCNFLLVCFFGITDHESNIRMPILSNLK